MTNNTYNYPTIVAWHETSFKYYIDNLVRLARETNAPHNATYPHKDSAGNVTGWSTTDDVTDFDTRADMQRVREALEGYYE